MQPTIERLHHILRTQVKGFLVERGHQQNRRPGIPILTTANLDTKFLHGPGSNVLAERSSNIETSDVAVSTADVENVGIFWIGSDVSTLAAACRKPVARRDLPGVRPA